MTTSIGREFSRSAKSRASARSEVRRRRRSFISSPLYHATRPTRQRLLQLVRNHWGNIEHGLRYGRDEVLGEDRSTIFSGNARHNLAALRNAALNWLRRDGISKFAATLRSFARQPLRLFTRLGDVK